MKTTKRSALVLYVIIALLFCPYTKGQDAQGFVKSLQSNFDSYETLSASFTQSSANGQGASGKFYFKKQNSMRIELAQMNIITDGKTVWNYNKRENKVIISNYKEKDASLFSIPKMISTYPASCDISLETKDKNKVVVLKPLNKKLGFKQAKLFCADAKSINEVQITDLSDNSMTIVLSGVKINSAIDSSMFTFTIKDGIKVVDLR